MAKRNKIYKISLAGSVTRYFLQFFVPLIIVTIVLNIFALKIIHQRELDKMSYEVDSASAALNNYLEQIESFAFDISINSKIQEMLITNVSPYISAQAQAQAFNTILGLNRYYDLNIVHISVMTPEQRNILSVGYTQTEPYPYDTSFAGNEAYSDWVFSGATKYYTLADKTYHIVSYYQKVYHLTSKKCIGIVRIDVAERNLRDIYLGTGSGIFRQLYLKERGGSLVRVVAESAGENVMSTGLDEITVDVNDKFLLTEKFDPVKLLQENNFILPLIIFAAIFALLFIILSYRFLHLVVSPMYKLNESIQSMDSDAPLSRLELKKGNREMKVIYNGFNQLVDSLNEYIEKNREIMRQEQLAKTLYFQSQINPHFLYNTLDTLRWIALKNKDKEVADEIYHLSNLYRYYLNHEDVFVPVQEEVKLIETYMSIQHLRFHDKFDFRVNLETDAEGFMIPKLLLQPLIENSIQHGFPDKEESCMIILSVKKRHGALMIRLLDNGSGMDRETVEKINTVGFTRDDSFAIANIKKRLELYYGSQAGIRFRSRLGKGTFVKIKVPAIHQINDKEDGS